MRWQLHQVRGEGREGQTAMGALIKEGPDPHLGSFRTTMTLNWNFPIRRMTLQNPIILVTHSTLASSGLHQTPQIPPTNTEQHSGKINCFPATLHFSLLGNHLESAIN